MAQDPVTGERRILGYAARSTTNGMRLSLRYDGAQMERMSTASLHSTCPDTGAAYPLRDPDALKYPTQRGFPSMSASP